MYQYAMCVTSHYENAIYVSVQQLKTYFESVRSQYGRITDPSKRRSGRGAMFDLSPRDQFIKTHYSFLDSHIVRVPSRTNTTVSLSFMIYDIIIYGK